MNNRVSYPRVIIPLITFFLVMMFFGLYYFFWVSNQQTYFLERNFRVLGDISDLIRRQISGYTENLENVIENDYLKRYHSPDSLRLVFKKNVALIPNLVLEDEIVLEKISENSPNQIPNSSLTDSISLQFEDDKYVLHYKVSDVTKNGTWYVQLHAGIEIGAIVKPFLRNDVYDDMLVVNHRGEVIFQDAAAGMKITRLDALIEKLEGKEAYTQQASSSFVVEDKFAGVEYKLFFQPIQIPFYRSGSSEENYSTGGDDHRLLQWIICGVVRADRFQRDSMAISTSFIVLFMFFVVLIGLSWPFLKMLFMGRNEMLRTADVIMMVIAAFLGTSLLTIFFLDTYFYFVRLKSVMDVQLREFSGQIETNFNTELNDAYNQLTTITEKYIREKDIIRTGVLGDSSFQGSYPYYEMVFWADADGMQKAKWTIQEATTQFIDVKERSYFRALKRKRHWTKDFGDKSIQFYIEPIYSWNTGENLSILGIPIDGAVESTKDAPKFAYLDTRFPSLIQPVMPDGFGFCIIDDGYRVLFHSDEIRNLRENLKNECRNDRALQAAVYGRSEDIFNTNYMGKDCRFFVKPLNNIPWFLIVYYSKDLLRTTNLEILSISLELLIFYELLFFLTTFSIIAMGLIFFHSRSGYWTTWYWPDQRLTQYYRALGGLSLLVAMVFGISIYALSLRLSIIITFVLPFIAVFLAFVIVYRGTRKVQEKNGKNRNGSGEPGEGSNVNGEGRKSIPLIDIERLLPFKRAYSLACTGLLLLMGVLPAIVFFSAAFQIETELFIKHAQISLARALENRVSVVEDKYRNIRLYNREGFISKRLFSHREDMYEEFFFDTKSQYRATLSSFDAADDTADESYKSVLVEYLRPLYNQAAIETKGLVHRFSSDSIWSWIRTKDNALVLYKKGFSGRNGNLAIQTSLMDFGPWSFLPDMAHSSDTFWNLGWILFFIFLYLMSKFIAQRIFLSDLDDPPGMENIYYDRMIEQFRGAKNAIEEIQEQVRNAQFQNILVITPDSSSEVGQFDERDVIDIIALTNAGRKDESTTIDGDRGHSDLPKSTPISRLAEAFDYHEYKNRGVKIIVVNHLEYKLDDYAHNSEKLQLMEKLLHTLDAKFIVYSTIDPMFYFAMNGGIFRESKKAELLSPQEIIRWANVFRNFARIHLRERGNPESLQKTLQNNLSEVDVDDDFEKGKISEIKELLRQECEVDKRLQEIGIEISGLPRETLMNCTREQIILQVLYWADTHYQSIWHTCSIEERNVLFDLAQNGFVNSKNMRVIRWLLRRGLIKKTPVLKTMNESFRRFIVSSIGWEDIAAWEKQEEKSAWNMFKAPLLLLLISAALFLYVTQPKAFNYITAFITTLAVGVPALSRIIASLQHDRVKSGGA